MIIESSDVFKTFRTLVEVFLSLLHNLLANTQCICLYPKCIRCIQNSVVTSDTVYLPNDSDVIVGHCKQNQITQKYAGVCHLK